MCKALFLAFDANKTVHHTRKFLFEGHLLLAHKDYRICHMDEYTRLLEKQDQQHKSNVELREENLMLHKKGQSYIDNTVFKKNIGLT